MMKNKKLNYKFYYIFGFIIVFVFLFLFIFFISLPLAIKDFPEYLGWISIVVCLMAFVGIIFGVYLLKKANFLKMNTKVRDAYKNEKINFDDKNKY